MPLFDATHIVHILMVLGCLICLIWWASDGSLSPLGCPPEMPNAFRATVQQTGSLKNTVMVVVLFSGQSAINGVFCFSYKSICRYAEAKIISATMSMYYIPIYHLNVPHIYSWCFYIYIIYLSSIHQLYSARLSLYICIYSIYICYYLSSIYHLFIIYLSAIFSYILYIYNIFSILYVFLYTHRIHGAAIYGVPWIPSIYPSHVSQATFVELSVPLAARLAEALGLPGAAPKMMGRLAWFKHQKCWFHGIFIGIL